jgi:GH25 family lysozyme M1 (1,4-beta-N-acetylmuramidase)
MSDYGIDVSGYNTITDWAAVRTMNSWAWAKATQGGGYTNPLFASQMAGGQQASLVMGAYHFPDPRVSVATNVAHFVAVAREAGAFGRGALLPMLDMENSPGDGITWSASGANGFILAFRDALRNATGVAQLCVYGPESWYAGGFLQPSQWADSAVYLCAAQYSGQPGQLGWSHARLAIHQYTDSAPTPGAARVTDRSVILAPYSLAQLTIGGAVSPAVTPKNLTEDDMFQFVVDLSSDDGHGTYTRTAMLRAGTPAVSGVAWSEIKTKISAYGGDGTGSAIGVSAQEYADIISDSDKYKSVLGIAPTVSVTINQGGGTTTGQATASPQTGHYTFTPDAPAAG